VLLRFRKAENGQTLVEYGMVLSIVSIASVASLLALQGSILGFFDGVIDTLTSIL
jgi:Flp pilus assembly pilin Flp